MPHAALTTPSTASSTVPVLPPAAQPVPRDPASPVVHLHPMRNQGVASFRQPKLYIATTLSPVLKSVRATLIDPHWWVAMEEEYAALMSNGTWDLVPCPRGANVVIDKWIFKYMFKADETLGRYKAR
jgi:hypothetical protein